MLYWKRVLSESVIHNFTFNGFSVDSSLPVIRAYTLLLILTHDERNVLKCSELISNNNKAVLYQIRKLMINSVDLEKLEKMRISIVIAADAQREMSESLPVCPFFHFLSVVCNRTLQHYFAVSWHVLSNGLYPFCIQNVIAWNHLCVPSPLVWVAVPLSYCWTGWVSATDSEYYLKWMIDACRRCWFVSRVGMGDVFWKARTGMIWIYKGLWASETSYSARGIMHCHYVLSFALFAW